MSHPHDSSSTNARSAKKSRWSKLTAAKARRQKLSLEQLEDRRVMAAEVTPELQPLATADSTQVSTIQWQGKPVEVKTGSWLVSFKDGAPAVDVAAYIQERVATIDKVGRKPMTQRQLGNQQIALEADPQLTYQQLFNSISTLPGLRYVEPDFIVKATTTVPNDPQLNGMYGLENSGVYSAWDVSTGSSSVVVGVIDSGVDYLHPDLAPNMWRNPGEIAGDGIDNDRNGYRDDVYGYDFINLDGDPMDDAGHGTHVAGTISAAGNNGLGVTGVTWNSKIMALKFLGSNGSGPISAAVSALNYATMMRTRYGINIRITNNSWGGGAYSQAMNDALTASANANMLFVVAAGNAASNNDATVSYPSGYPQPNIIAVASTTQDDTLSSFSNYGLTSVDIAAPGSGIYSTTRGNTYGTMSGTSMASPHVAGAAALLLGAAPTATYQQIRDALYQGADRLSALQGKVSSGGRLNVANSLSLILGDSGDTLSTARTTSLDQLGDQFELTQARLGDGTAGLKDVDLYRVQVAAGSQLTANALAIPGGVDGNRILRLFNSAGVELSAADDPTTNSAQLAYQFVAAGSYYVGVSSGSNGNYSPTVAGSGTGGSTADYALKLSLDVPDSFANAKPLSLSSTGSVRQYNSRLGDGLFADQDVDLFSITATAGTLITAMTSQVKTGDTVNTVLRLFSANGAVLATGDSPSSDNAGINYRIPTDGVYYFGVSGSGNVTYDPTQLGSGNAGAVGDYSLTISASQTVTETAAEMDLHALVGGDGSRGFVISGQDAYAEITAPSSTRKLGDVSGDGVDDFLVAVTGDVGVGPTNYVFVVFGKSDSDGDLPAELDVYSLDGTNGYRIQGLQLFDRTGLISGGAGDVNNDGLLDIVIGAIAAIPSSDRDDAGQTYVVFGGQLSNLDARDGQVDGLIQLAHLDGNTGFTINGAIAKGLAGRSQSAGDFNDDGFDDLVIGAPAANTSQGAGYVVFGKPSFPAVVELSQLNGSNGFSIIALADSGSLAAMIGDAGDLNGDGISDIYVSSAGTDVNGLVNVGRLHVIYGSRSFGQLGSPSTFNLASLNGSNGFTVQGVAEFDNFSIAVSNSGDVNGDGRDDLLVLASGVDFVDRASAGAAYILYGRSASQSPFPTLLLSNAIEGAWGTVIMGATVNESLASSGLGGDFDGDGINEIILATASASPNGVQAAGRTYVVYGSRVLPGRIDLASMLTSGGGQGVYGRVFNGYLDGSGMRGNIAGDINNDGYSDLRIGAPYTDILGKTAAGQIYMVYGEAARAGVRLSATAGLSTTESGGVATLQVALSRKPTAPVTLPLQISDATEGSLTITSLTFDSTNWNIPQSVVVRGVDDTVVDGSVVYSLQLLPTVSSDPAYVGINPNDVTLVNTDDDVLQTQFFVVNDGSPDRTFEYTSSGSLVENYALNTGNTAPRGAATSTAGDKVWVIDNNRVVYVYNATGTLLGSWTANSLSTRAQPTGITTNGTDIWIVDSRDDRVYRYAGATSRLSGSQSAISNFALASGNTAPTDIVTNGVSIWTVNDASVDRVYKYTLSGSALGNWSIDTRNATPTGISLDPTNPSSLWIVDAGTDQVYRYDAATNRTSGSQSASVQFVLGAGNLNPQGIAFVPTASNAQRLSGQAVERTEDLHGPAITGFAPTRHDLNESSSDVTTASMQLLTQTSKASTLRGSSYQPADARAPLNTTSSRAPFNAKRIDEVMAVGGVDWFDAIVDDLGVCILDA